MGGCGGGCRGVQGGVERRKVEGEGLLGSTKEGEDADAELEMRLGVGTWRDGRRDEKSAVHLPASPVWWCSQGGSTGVGGHVNGRFSVGDRDQRGRGGHSRCLLQS